jgi:hypothetical protein
MEAFCLGLAISATWNHVRPLLVSLRLPRALEVGFYSLSRLTESGDLLG